MNLLPMITLASWMGFLKGLFIVLFIVSCILLMGIILLQKGRGGGLSSAFGGAMSSSPFGTKTGDVFTWITVVLAAVFLGAAVVLNVVYQERKLADPQETQQPAGGSAEDKQPPATTTPEAESSTHAPADTQTHQD